MKLTESEMTNDSPPVSWSPMNWRDTPSSVSGCGSKLGVTTTGERTSRPSSCSTKKKARPWWRVPRWCQNWFSRCHRRIAPLAQIGTGPDEIPSAASRYRPARPADYTRYQPRLCDRLSKNGYARMIASFRPERRCTPANRYARTRICRVSEFRISLARTRGDRPRSLRRPFAGGNRLPVEPGPKARGTALVESPPLAYI